MKQSNRKARRLFGAAEKKRAASKFTEAIPLYIEARRLSAGDALLKADCAFALGDVHRMTGDFKKAERRYKEAHGLSLKLWLSGEAGGEASALDALAGLGLAYRATGRLKDALAIFNACLGRYKRLNDTAGVAFTVWARAGALRLTGETAKAISGFKEAKGLFSKQRDKSGAGYCLTGLGGASRVHGDYVLSGRYYKEANRVFRSIKDTFGIAYSYCGIANSLRMRGRFKESLEFFKKARENYKKIGDRVSYAYTLWGEGSAFAMLGRHGDAINGFEAAYRLFKETGDRRGVVYCMITIGQLEFMANPKKGSALVKKALKEALSLGIRTEAGYARQALNAMKKTPGDLPLNLA